MKVEDFIQLNNKETNDIKYRIIKTSDKQDCVVVYFDNKEKICVEIENYFKESLNSKEGIDEKTYLKLKEQERIYLSYKGALRKLSTKDYTVKQIEDYLKIKRQLNKKEIDIIINKLKSYDLLNDERYCENRANYLNNQLLSYKQIKIKLSKEGVNNNLVEKYVINNSEDEYSKARKLAIKYSNSIRNKSLNATRQAILNKVVNAGYSYEAGKDAVNCLNLHSNNELELLKKDYVKAKSKYEKKYENYELRNHIYSYLANKGFKSEDIKKVMED